MKLKELGIWAGITVVFIATIWGLIAMVNSKSSATSKISVPPPVSKDDQVLGTSIRVKAILIEYADFQCLACKIYAPMLKQLKKDFGNDLLVVSRFFPLINSHKNTMSSSQAAFAAGMQDKFWEMSDLLYENQEDWADSTSAQDIFIGYARKLNLDIEQFVNDYNAESTKKFIIDQINSGISIGINYTPTFFLNGKAIDNPRTYEAFKKLIQNEINKE